jgi:hypothetical protein
MRPRTTNRPGGEFSSIRAVLSDVPIVRSHNYRPAPIRHPNPLLPNQDAQARSPRRVASNGARTRKERALDRILAAQRAFSSPIVSCAEWEKAFPEFAGWTEAALNREMLLRIGELILAEKSRR